MGTTAVPAALGFALSYAGMRAWCEYDCGCANPIQCSACVGEAEIPYYWTVCDTFQMGANQPYDFEGLGCGLWEATENLPAEFWWTIGGRR